MSAASPAAVVACLCAMGYVPKHAHRVAAGQPLVSVSPQLAVVAMARGPRACTPVMRRAPVPLPARGCWWSTSNKALIVEAVLIGQIDLETVPDLYPDITTEDAEGWIRTAMNAGQDHQRTARRRAA